MQSRLFVFQHTQFVYVAKVLEHWTEVSLFQMMWYLSDK